jgi:hypothetical protein
VLEFLLLGKIAAMSSLVAPHLWIDNLICLVSGKECKKWMYVVTFASVCFWQQ